MRTIKVLLIVISILLNCQIRAEEVKRIELSTYNYKYSFVGVCNNFAFLAVKDLEATFKLDLTSGELSKIEIHYEKLICSSEFGLILVSENSAYLESVDRFIKFDYFPQTVRDFIPYAIGGKTFIFNSEGEDEMVWDNAFTNAIFNKSSASYLVSHQNNIFSLSKSSIVALEVDIPENTGSLSPITINSLLDDYILIGVINYSNKKRYRALINEVVTRVKFVEETEFLRRLKRSIVRGEAIFLGNAMFENVADLAELKYSEIIERDFYWSDGKYIYSTEKVEGYVVVRKSEIK